MFQRCIQRHGQFVNLFSKTFHHRLSDPRVGSLNTVDSDSTQRVIQGGPKNILLETIDKLVVNSNFVNHPVS